MVEDPNPIPATAMGQYSSGRLSEPSYAVVESVTCAGGKPRQHHFDGVAPDGSAADQQRSDDRRNTAPTPIELAPQDFEALERQAGQRSGDSSPVRRATRLSEYITSARGRPRRQLPTDPGLPLFAPMIHG